MGAERTEKATPKRQEKARSEGQISKSQDLNSALILTANIAILFCFAPMISHELMTVLRYTFLHLDPRELDSSVIALLIPYAQPVAFTLFPVLISSMIATIVIMRLLTGSLFTLTPLKPKWDKLSPASIMKGLKSKFSPVEPKQLVELAKSFLKLAIIGNVGYSVIESRLPELLGLLGVPLQASFSTIISVLFQMIVNICIAMIVIGFLDKKYQDYEYDKSLKMTKEDVKDERKNMEGDPAIKSKIKSAQMEFMRQKMMYNVKTADVVVTNPTHYAVAIRYDTSIAPAPQVVAKGVDFMAFKIREIAEANNVPIKENKPLARTLYKVVPLEGIVPPELYVAVAELLAFVYNQDKRRR